MKRISETDFISKWSCVLWWQFWGGGGGGGEQGGGWGGEDYYVHEKYNYVSVNADLLINLCNVCFIYYNVVYGTVKSLCNTNLYAIQIFMCPELDSHNSRKLMYVLKNVALQYYPL